MDCVILKAKGNGQPKERPPKAGVSLLKTKVPQRDTKSEEVDPAFMPFVFVGTVSVSRGEEKKDSYVA